MKSSVLMGMVAIIVTASCTPDLSPDAGSVSLTTISTAVETTTSSPASTATPSSVTSTLAEDAAFAFPLSGEFLVYGQDGVLVVDEDGGASAALGSPTAVAVAVGDSMVLTQDPDESDVYPPQRGWTFEIHQPSAEPALVAVSNRQLRLFDAGLVNGRPVAVATLINWADQDTYEDLLLVDLDPAPSTDPGQMFTDLGRVGGWESLVVGAKLSSDVIVLTTPGGFEARSLTGDVLWAGIADDWDRPFVVTDTELLVVESRFEDTDFRPVLELRRYALATGELLNESTIELDADFEGGFCLVVDFDGARLICDESYGGPFAVHLETGQIQLISDLDRGMPAVISKAFG